MKNSNLILTLFALILSLAACTKKDTPASGIAPLAASTQSIQGRWTASSAQLIVTAKNSEKPVRTSIINLPAKAWEFGADGNLHIQTGATSLSTPYSQDGQHITLTHNGTADQLELGANNNEITLTSTHQMPDGTIATEVIHLVK